MNHAVLIKAGELEKKDLAHQPTLKEAQDFVGGHIQTIKARDDNLNVAVTLVVNEDGKIVNLPLNIRATVDYSINSKHFPLVGNVIVLYGWQTLA